MRRDIPRSRPTCSTLTKYRQVYGCIYHGISRSITKRKYQLDRRYVCFYDLALFFNSPSLGKIREQSNIYSPRILLNFTNLNKYAIDNTIMRIQRGDVQVSREESAGKQKGKKES